jgi:hypothetical protein
MFFLSPRNSRKSWCKISSRTTLAVGSIVNSSRLWTGEDSIVIFPYWGKLTISLVIFLLRRIVRPSYVVSGRYSIFSHTPLPVLGIEHFRAGNVPIKNVPGPPLAGHRGVTMYYSDTFWNPWYSLSKAQSLDPCHSYPMPRAVALDTEMRLEPWHSHTECDA